MIQLVLMALVNCFRLDPSRSLKARLFLFEQLVDDAVTKAEAATGHLRRSATLGTKSWEIYQRSLSRFPANFTTIHHWDIIYRWVLSEDSLQCTS